MLFVFFSFFRFSRNPLFRRFEYNNDDEKGKKNKQNLGRWLGWAICKRDTVYDKYYELARSCS